MQSTNLEKRIKRHIVGRRHDFFAVTLPGHEPSCIQELLPLSDTLDVKKAVTGGVAFTGRLTDLYLANLHVRTAVRILMRLGRFKATNFRQLEARIGKIPWELYLPPGAVPDLKVTAHRCRLYHTGAVADHIKDRIAVYWQSRGIDAQPLKTQTLFLRLHHDRAGLSLDSSGKPLYQRGLKTHTAQAPLRETTAAAILILAGYHRDTVLLDPMCGSGTFSLEAALMAKQAAPGLHRRFAFMQWPAFRPKQWRHLRQNAQAKISPMAAPLIRASDADKTAVKQLQGCVDRCNLADAVTIAHQDFFSLRPAAFTDRPGLIVLNPPYGRRLRSQSDIEKQYQDMAAKLKKDFSGWKTALVVPTPSLADRLMLDVKSMRLDHGGLQLTLLWGKLGVK
jgi:putative N6-adenine-specific DNA methylase